MSRPRFFSVPSCENAPYTKTLRFVIKPFTCLESKSQKNAFFNAFFSLERRGESPSSLFFTGEILPKKIRNSKFKNEVIMGGSNSQKLGKAT